MDVNGDLTHGHNQLLQVSEGTRMAMLMNQQVGAMNLPPPPPGPYWSEEQVMQPMVYQQQPGELGADPMQEQMMIIKAFIADKELGSVKVKEVRAEIQSKTGLLPSKEETKKMIQRILEAQVDERSEEEEQVVYTGKKVQLSDELGAVIGVQHATKRETYQKLMNYVDVHNLKNPANAGEIVCDNRLKAVFNRDIVHMFELKTLLKAHVLESSNSSTLNGQEESDDEDFDALVDEDAIRIHEETAAQLKKRNENRKSATKGALTKAKKAKANSTSRGGFGKDTLKMSPVLVEFLGKDDLTRPQVVKELWNYIKRHNLQNPSNRTRINCDQALKKVFHRDEITMFNMNRFLTVHLKSNKAWEAGDTTFDYSKLDMTDAEWEILTKSKPESATKKRRRERKEAGDMPRKRGGFTESELLSERLAAFMGQDTATRGEVVKKLWEHIRAHDLQNPTNKQEIICDDVLQDLMGHERVTQFTINKFIQPHFIKKSKSKPSLNDT